MMLMNSSSTHHGGHRPAINLMSALTYLSQTKTLIIIKDILFNLFGYVMGHMSQVV